MKIQWAAGAQTNLRELYDYIAEDSPQNAERFITRLFDAIDHLADQPKMGRRVPEAGMDPNKLWRRARRSAPRGKMVNIRTVIV